MLSAWREDIEMTPHKVEIGERYEDDSGWDRRLMIDLLGGRLEIEMQSQTISMNPRELTWLRQAIDAADKALGLTP
jgi:hypothetical protein